MKANNTISKIIKNILIILFLSVCLMPIFAFASSVSQVFHYEPEVVNLTGIIKIKTFPGAPNYESLEKGDDLESCPYLLLDRPIDVTRSAADKNLQTDTTTEKNLKIIQIATSSDDNWNNKYIGRHVRVTGTLYHRLTGHHHTRVLIYANHFEMVW